MNHTYKIQNPAVRLTALLLAFLLVSGSFCICAGAADLPETDDNAALAALLEEPLPEVDPAEDYIVRYTDRTVGRNADEGDHWAQLDGESLEDALEDGTVAYYEADTTVTLLDDTDAQWEHSMVHLDAMEQLDADGTGIVVGVIDSGIADHAEFSGRLLPGHNCIDDNDDATDTYGHGTKVAGILAAACDGTGISGVAPGAELVPLKAFDGKTTYLSNLVTAIYEGTDTYHCDLLNMSFGTTKVSGALEYAVNYAASQGVIMIAAVGNDGTEAVQYPAGYDAVIGVASVNQDGTHASSSQCNESVAISAPGVLISTTTMDGSYGTFSGTSFATPVVTGAIADLLSINPELTAEQISTLLTGTAVDAGDEGYDTSYGWGILDLQAARDALIGSTSLYFAPLSITADSSVTVFLSRLSGDWTDLTLVTTVTDDAGTMTAAGTTDLTLDENGKLTTEVRIPSEIEADSLLPENLSPLAVQQLTQADGSTVTVYAVRTCTCFLDVNREQYWYDAVLWAAENSIVYGIGSRLFAPDATCSRAQIVTFLWRTAGSPAPTSTVNKFTDVDASAYYYDAVLWCVEQGIVYGTTGTTFEPDTVCTRAQAATFLWRYALEPAPAGSTNRFTDVRASDYYYEATLWGSENGIIYGTGDTTFEPDTACTRAQAVAFLYRMLNR